VLINIEYEYEFETRTFLLTQLYSKRHALINTLQGALKIKALNLQCIQKMMRESPSYMSS